MLIIENIANQYRMISWVTYPYLLLVQSAEFVDFDAVDLEVDNQVSVYSFCSSDVADPGLVECFFFEDLFCIHL